MYKRTERGIATTGSVPTISQADAKFDHVRVETASGNKVDEPRKTTCVSSVQVHCSFIVLNLVR